MQHLSIIGIRFFPIQFVAQHRMPNRLEVNPDLVCSSSKYLAKHQRRLVRFADHLIPRMGPAATVENRHLLPVHRVTPNRLEYFARAFREAWNTQRQIEFLDLSSSELSGQSRVRDIILGNYKAAARLFVQPMDDTRSQFATYPAQIRNAMQQRINESPALNAGARVNRHPGGFIDND